MSDRNSTEVYYVNGIAVRDEHIGASQGKRFERLVVLGKIFRTRQGGKKQFARWSCVCLCDCGNTIVARTSSIVDGGTVSCGCYAKEQTSKRSKTHGMTDHPLHVVWSGMKRRCNGTSKAHKKRYSDRGIRVCQEWENSFSAFKDWALANGWEPGLQIDRFPDNDGDYEPNNCRFVTGQVNCNNKENTRFIEAFGETKSVGDWSRDERCKVDIKCLQDRLKKGWDGETAISTPPLSRSEIAKIVNDKRWGKSA